MDDSSKTVSKDLYAFCLSPLSIILLSMSNEEVEEYRQTYQMPNCLPWK